MKNFKWKSVVAVILALSLLTTPVLAADNTASLMEKIKSLVTIIQTYYYKDVSASALLEGAIKGMFGVLDKHSTYFNPEEFEKFNSEIYGDFGGLGIYIEEKDDYIQVISAIEGTPAFKAGLKSGDKILYVNGTDIKGYSTEQASALMKGQPGTNVKIGIKREGIDNVIYMELTREIIKINPIEYKIMDENLGYIKITQFNDHALENIQKALNEFKAKNVKGIVIDVRNNPGGLLNQAVDICKLLIPKGPIVSIRYKDKPQQVYSSELAKAPYKIVMLVNEGSASASEIMAAAIKESGTGKLVGTKTYGKGTVQTVLALTDGSGMKITIANYLTPKGFILDGVGIMPDFEVQNTSIDEVKGYAELNGQRPVKNRLIGLDVLGVQQRLKALGYNISATDGIFGPRTLTAVKQFQKDNKLKIDGSMDSDDIKLLNEKFDATGGSKDAQMDKAIVELKKMIENK